MTAGDGDRDAATCSRITEHGHDRASHAVMPLTAIQSEYSIMERTLSPTRHRLSSRSAR